MLLQNAQFDMNSNLVTRHVNQNMGFFFLAPKLGRGKAKTHTHRYRWSLNFGLLGSTSNTCAYPTNTALVISTRD